MRKVYSHENLAMLQTAKGLLDLRGIDSFVKNEYHASGGHVGWESIPIELWVRNSADADTAIAILERELSEPQLPDWTCSKCQEINAGSFETCWKCQQERPETTPP